jgi:negative regulator of sigma-B (phosphoserine phosphatase)
VKTIPTGALVAVVDGLGHGAEAAGAARAAVATLGEYAHESLLALVERCHRALRRTRGAVMSVAHFNHGAGIMTWVGVGNVEGTLLQAHPSNGRPAGAPLITRGGIMIRASCPLVVKVYGRHVVVTELPAPTISR